MTVSEPLTLVAQGSFTAGGTVVEEPGTFDPKRPGESAGQSYHADHVYAFYQEPAEARKLPVIMMHGSAQSSKCWETTADGREGFQTLLLRRRFKTYVLDLPRRGTAARSTVEATISPKADEQTWFNQFRIGLWPDFFPGVAFDTAPETLNQFFRSMVPNVGPLDKDIASDAMTALLDKTGPAILFSHSRGGGYGWSTAMRNANVRGIVAFEPGSSFVFPKDALPEPIPNALDVLEGEVVSDEDFAALTRIPILILYGDNIPEDPVSEPARDSWRARLQMARIWRDAVNGRGGKVRLLHLPTVGIVGNTHFVFSDRNNLEVLDRVCAFLESEGLSL